MQMIHQHRSKSRPVKIDAKPEPITIDAARTAVMVVDMQNDFGTEAACSTMLDLYSIIQRAIGPTATVLASRATPPQIIYLKMGFHPDLRT